MNEVIQFSARRPEKQVCALPPSSPPADPRAAVAWISACLALVRTAAMSDNEAQDWLMVAAQTVGHYPADILEAACLHARRTCRHHSQIVPSVVEEADRQVERGARLRQLETVRAKTAPQPPLALPAAPPLTQAAVDRMDDLLIRIGLATGALVRLDDDSVVPAP